ncbi:MAG: pitrilysin family protein, partial [Bacteroidetes bacterium]|nr:pitrilysin family protein [Bacteroidota bacterium]
MIKKQGILGLAWLLVSFSMIAQNVKFSARDIDIPYTKYLLPNGLTLVVHEDHKAPIVAVNMWYHVGSKNEKPGKSGFAHLFEHLMFNGSENYNDDYFQALERIGGTDLNGTTNRDRTNYFQNIPIAALDQVLWLESDRMGHLLGAIDQARLDEQRGVVQNEKRQGENQPYGRQRDLLTKAMYPKGHPYSWTVIGDMEDLNAASLEDVHEWFKAYYGAANAVIAIAGDISPDEAQKKVKKYFGDIHSGPTISRPEVNIPQHSSNTREYYQDRVPEARFMRVWNTPQYGSVEDIYFDVISSILSTGKNSRLYKRFVYEDQIASSANAYQASSEIASTYNIQINAKSGVDIQDIEKVVNEVMDDFIKNGPTQKELDRAKSTYFSNFIKGMERIGGFGGKSDILASGTTYHGNPEHYKKVLGYVENVTIEEIKATAQKWLTKYHHTLICTPFPEYVNDASGADRSKLPELGEPVAFKFPVIQRTTLKNGMNVVLAQRTGVPTVVVDMMVNAGYSSDQFASPGTATLAMNMMDEGTKNMTSLQINEKLQFLGASLRTSSDLDISYITLNTLMPTWKESLSLFADVVLNPAFPEKEFERLKKEQIATIQREKSRPISMALRVMTKYMYGDGHAYSLPYTGSGFEETVSKLTREDLVSFYDRWMKPNNVTIVVVGDISLKELTVELEKYFAKWKKGETPTKNISVVKPPDGNKLYFMDRPESQQSVIIAGHLTNPYGEVSEIGREAMIGVLGGQFTSRINMNLREDKHWAYGAGGFVIGAKGQRPFVLYAPVQTDKTAESIQEMIKEVNQYVGDNPITQEELDKIKGNTVLKLPGKWETNNAVSNSLNTLVK